MTAKGITIGGIIALVGAISFFAIILNYTTQPVTSQATETFVTESVNQMIPEEVTILSKLAKVGGSAGAFLIILFIIFWKKIKNYRVPI